MKRTILFLLVQLVISSLAFGQEVYQWVDEKGTIHFVDDLTLVPEKYRDQAQKKDPSKIPFSSYEAESRDKPDEGPEQRDLIGRGEDWWRAKVKEWNEKLLHTQKNYETAFAEWKAKEKELDESKFKPNSFKRKLKAEIKVLEDKLKEWEKQRGEAKNMVEKVLPKEAADYKADPEWLKMKE